MIINNKIFFFLVNNIVQKPNIIYEIISAEIDQEGKFIPVESPKRIVELRKVNESIVLYNSSLVECLTSKYKGNKPATRNDIKQISTLYISNGYNLTNLFFK